MAKAKKIPYLDPEKSLKTCLRKILLTRFEEMISFEAGTVQGSDIEQLHDMRVASRRIQAVMKVFRAAFRAREFKRHYKIIRGLKDNLGVVRHYDVFIDALEKSLTPLPSPKEASSLTIRPRRGEDDRRAIELLIIRQKSLRENQRKQLVRYLRELNKRNYKEKFLRFVTAN